MIQVQELKTVQEFLLIQSRERDSQRLCIHQYQLRIDRRGQRGEERVERESCSVRKNRRIRCFLLGQGGQELEFERGPIVS